MAATNHLALGHAAPAGTVIGRRSFLSTMAGAAATLGLAARGSGSTAPASSLDAAAPLPTTVPRGTQLTIAGPSTRLQVQLADLIETWFTHGAADGLNIMPPLYPSQFEVFVNEVVPILQRRGLFHTAYEGATLREHYGLPRPESRFAVRREDRAATGGDEAARLVAAPARSA